jgi:hypothetical protein
MQADGIDFWVVRKGEDAYKVAPEVADEISEHPNDGVCLFCGDGHKISARWYVRGKNLRHGRDLCGLCATQR